MPLAVLLLAGVATAERPGPGRWEKFRTHRFDASLDSEQRAMIEQLEALGYATGSKDAPTGLENVTRHIPDRSQSGLNLYSSGHAPEAILVDTRGHVLHRWRYEFRSAWPDFPVGFKHPNTGYWRRVHLYENGDLLAIFEGLGILKLDRSSNLLWASPVRAHHDVEVAPTGEVYVLSSEAHVVPRVDPRRPILEDFVSVLDGETGEEKRRVSLLEAIQKSPWARLLERSTRALASRASEAGDLFHTNSLRLLDGSWADEIPAFRRGNVLVSILKLDALAVVDMDAEAVVWVHTGAFRRQHDPRPLANGKMLLFDNMGPGPDRSRVVELDLHSKHRAQEIAWQFGHTQAEPLYSKTCGTAQRLANGNTLITESDGGRALEVTLDGQVVWEFYNPHRAGKDGGYIATLFELIRLPADFPAEWASKPAAGSLPGEN